MAVRQYIGARYVTKIYENSLDPSSAEWEAGVNYEPLVMVTYNNGSYLSKKNVPASVGDPAANTTYWVQTGFYNGQIAALQAAVSSLTEKVDILDLGIVFPETYGAVADGVTDCTGAIQQAIDENPDKLIFFGGGTYSITNTLSGVRGIHFLLSSNSSIKADAPMDVMIYTDIVESTGDSSARDRNTIIQGGTIDANYNANYCIAYNNCIGATFRDIRIYNFNVAGIHNRFRYDGVDTGVCGSNYHENLYIMIFNPTYNADTKGIIANGQDCVFNSITIVNCKTGFYCLHGGHRLFNVHPWLNYVPMYGGSIGFNIAGRMIMDECSSDGLQTAIHLNKTLVNTSIIDLTSFRYRFAPDYVSDSDMIAAGGYFVFDIESGLTAYINNNNAEFVVEYPSANGKFINDDRYTNVRIFEFYKSTNSFASSRALALPNYIGDIDNLDAQIGAIEIPDNSDLNDYTHVGIFKSLGGVHTQTMSNVPTNAPFSNSGFNLKVEKYGYVTQTLRTPTVSATYTETVAYRQYNGTTWSPWLYY